MLPRVGRRRPIQGLVHIHGNGSAAGFESVMRFEAGQQTEKEQRIREIRSDGIRWRPHGDSNPGYRRERARCNTDLTAII